MGIKLLLFTYVLLFALVASEPKVGDRMVVIAEKGELKTGQDVVGTVVAGTILTPEQINAEWLWVSGRDVSVKGWISRKNVLPLDDAVVFFTTAIRKKPSSSLHTIRGALWIANADYDQAIADFTEAIRLDRNNAVAWVNRGLALNYKKDWELAIENCTQAISLDPKNILAYKVRGVSSTAKGKYNDAIADFSEAIRLNPKDISSYRTRALAWDAIVDYGKAITDYDEVIRMDSKDVDAWLNRGSARSSQGQYALAIADFTEAIRLAPKNDVAHDCLAWVLGTCPDDEYRNGERAVAMATIACEQSLWKNAFRISTLAAAYAEAGQFDNAVKWQEKAIELDEVVSKEIKEARLALYKANKPYRQSQPPTVRNL